MLDCYDDVHTLSYSKVINIYKNYDQDKIRDVITQSIKGEYSAYEKDKLSDQISKIEKIINTLKNGLEIIDYRYIANIGARVLNNFGGQYDKEFEMNMYTWSLIQVHRSSKYNEKLLI
jgi:hypothetical protein